MFVGMAGATLYHIVCQDSRYACNLASTVFGLTGKAGTKSGFLCVSARCMGPFSDQTLKTFFLAQRRRGAEKNKHANWAHCRAQIALKADFAKVVFGQDG